MESPISLGEAPDLLPPRKGEFVTCEAGHLICEVVSDIQTGAPDWASCLGYWRLSELPTIGKPMTCPCGVKWGGIYLPTGNVHLHLERGWA